MANVSKLLYSTVVDENFLLEIDPEDEAKKSLLQARTKIRQRLKEAFASRSRELFGRAIAPRFFTQGSHSYKTLNDPAWPPEQQMDLDDGCYLPMSFVTGARPSQASALFFDFVDEVLEGLAEEEEWTFKEKDTCCRLVISDIAHIDVPLYAIPDVEFVLLEKAMDSRHASFSDRAKPDTWEALPSDSVLLAHRKEGWKVSDPRKIKTWFLGAVDIYGEKLRRVCRYLKAWRDHHKPALDEVSSILLMVCAWKSFEITRRAFVPDREDEALLMVLEKLPAYLEGDVLNPTDTDENINRVSSEGRKIAARYAKDFADQLRRTISTVTDQNEAVAELQASLGQRVPYRPDLVSVAETAKITILSQPRKEVAAPVVGRSQSG
ncbi:CBASS cGAMP synthase [Rhizobium leguminosarum]|uniref:CBASS cGAMP synthase n=1 Tax=Rhizobium leguminosarum TaxID=384 RepID=UPI003F966F99